MIIIVSLLFMSILCLPTRGFPSISAPPCFRGTPRTVPLQSTDLRLLLKPAVDQFFLTDEREARSAAYLFWVLIQPVLLSSELNEIMQNTVVSLKREGKQTFNSLAAGQQGALQFALKPLQNMFSRALIKAFAVKHRLRLAVLGNLRPFAIYDNLLSSSLICP